MIGILFSGPSSHLLALGPHRRQLERLEMMRELHRALGLDLVHRVTSSSGMGAAGVSLRAKPASEGAVVVGLLPHHQVLEEFSMANRLSMATIHSIQTLYQSGHSNREIARLLAIDRGTVDAYVRRLQAASGDQWGPLGGGEPAHRRRTNRCSARPAPAARRTGSKPAKPAHRLSITGVDGPRRS